MGGGPVATTIGAVAGGLDATHSLTEEAGEEKVEEEQDPRNIKPLRFIRLYYCTVNPNRNVIR